MTTQIGIPYSRHIGPDFNTVQCPACGDIIQLQERKDWESYTGREYGEHFVAIHPGWTAPK